ATLAGGGAAENAASTQRGGAATKGREHRVIRWSRAAPSRKWLATSPKGSNSIAGGDAPGRAPALPSDPEGSPCRSSRPSRLDAARHRRPSRAAQVPIG